MKLNGLKWIMRAALTLAVVIGLALPGHAQQREIIISAAASLRDAFQELAPIFEKQTGFKANYNFAASGVLMQQIEAGAPADVFASAAQRQMDDLQKKGLIVESTRKDFTGNSLVLIIPANSKLKIKDFTDLANPEFARIAIGSPKTVPAGQYAQDALTTLQLWDKLQQRFIPAENVRQVLDYVSRDEVDAGLVYSSDAAIAGDKIRVVSQAPKGTHEEIVYPIAVIKDSKNARAAQQFIDLVLSKTGKDILAKYGFATP
jgi:molybdate transport system substrate-binding protein